MSSRRLGTSGSRRQAAPEDLIRTGSLAVAGTLARVSENTLHDEGPPAVSPRYGFSCVTRRSDPARATTFQTASELYP